MIWVATREIKIVGKGKKVIYQAGDAIPDFANWPEVPRRAHVNLGYVQAQDGESIKAKAPKKKPAAKKAKAPAVKQPKKQVEAVTTPPPKQAPAAEEAPGGVKCDQCGDTSKHFKNMKALNTHKAIAHK